MKCPNCDRVSDQSALVKCSHCGESFERGLLEELGHLDYLQKWVDEHRSDIGDYRAGIIQSRVGERQRKLLEGIKRPREVPQVEPIPVGREEPLAPPPKPVAVPPPVEVKPTPVVEIKPAPEKPAPVVTKVETKPMETPVPVVKHVPASPPKPKAAPKPAAPPKPRRPPIDWRKVITEAATSGALLRALLYLGAFMIVISASVLVILFWSNFSPALQLLFIASVPLSFYAGGWAIRTRLKLTQAGTVLTGIGAVLVAVDFAAIYQFGGLAQRVNGPIYWLIVTIFCTALYAFTAWRLQGEFFDYLTLLGGASILFTFTRLFRLPTEWSVTSVTAAGALMTIVASRYSKAGVVWREFGRAARYLAQILIPASVFYVMFSPAQPPVGHMMGFLFATVGYYVLAWQFPTLVFAYAALGASIGTVLFALRVTGIPIEWYSTVASVLALSYILIGQRVGRATIESNIIQNYVKALNTTGLILISLAALGGFVITFDNKIWAGVIAMTLASLDLGMCAYLFGRSRYTLIATGLFIVPFSIAILKWFDAVQMQTAPGIAWLTFAWGALAVAYVGLGAVLQETPAHNRWLYGWAHILTPIALFLLPFAYLLDARNWTSGPALVSLGMAIVVYLLSFTLQDSGRHSSLSAVSNWLPYGLGKAIFLWPIGLLLPIWSAVAWYDTDLLRPWFGAVLTGFGLIYIGVGQVLLKRAKEYRLPFHVFTYLVCMVGIFVSAPDLYLFLTALLVTVLSAAIMAYLYNRVVETVIASLLFVWPFQLSLDIFNFPYAVQTLGYALLASLAYTPIAIYLNKMQKSRGKFHHVPVFSVGYALVAYAIIESVILRGGEAYIPWVGVAVPLIATALFTFSASYFKTSRYSPAWAWAGILTFTVAFGQALTLFKVPTAYDALAWTGLAALYMIAERALFFTSQKETNEIQRFWSGMFHLPIIVFALALAVFGLSLSLPDTLNAFAGIQPENYLPPILAQVGVVLLSIASARLYQQRWPFFIEPFIAFLPATLFFVGYGKQIFGQPLTTPQYALIWTVLGAIHVIAGALTDRAKVRYAHGLYLGGYILLSWAVLWSVIERSTLVWTLGLWILASIASSLWVHFQRHQTWQEFIHLLFGKSKGPIQTTTHDAFQWFAAWAFPIWCVIFLREIGVSNNFSWLGLVLPPLAYLGLATWLRRVDSTYAIPLLSSAQFFTVIGLLISAPATVNYLLNTSGDENTLLAFIILHATAVIFYASSAWMYRSRGFAHVSAWLSIIAFSLAWKLYGVAFTPIRLVVPWLMWSAVLLVIGFALDRNKARYSHGPYLAGYVLAIYALACSTAIRLTNIYALAITILLALISYLVVHFGRHQSFEDFVHAFWRKADTVTRQIASTIFLFFASYAFPVLLAQILARYDYPLAWRGVSLALAAPLYIAIGLLVSKAKPRGTLLLVPTWALYSAGYALTAISAMVAFEDERLATYVLALDAIVYAVSAYIFQQAFWLYLSTVLAPTIALLILHQTDRYESTSVAWIFTGLALIYLAIGQLFDRNKKPEERDPIHPFAVPFYAPGFMLSAIALAVSSSDRMLALQVYSIGVVFYALSGWLFREALFIYPAAWLAAVPYYLAITLTPLETRWYGLAWLPLIILYIAIGRTFFHKQPLVPVGRGVLVQWLTHPAIPFYLLAYALSVSMISLSYINPLAITLAFAAGTILYMSSAFLFRMPAWIYASLFAAHMTLLAYFTIDPKGTEAYYLALPFHALTWAMSLLGYGFSRWIARPVSSEMDRAANEGRGRSEAFRFAFVENLLGHPWSRPFFVFAVTDIIVWQSIALNGYDTTITLALGHALLLTLFSILWMDGGLVYGVIGFGLLAVGASLKQAGVTFADALAIFGGIGFGLYLLARVLEPISSRFKSLTVWPTPLTHASIFLTAAAVIVGLPFVVSHMTATAASLAFAGALYITIAYRGRQYVLGYLGMALLEIAWVIVLYLSEVSQPQFYAIPGGLYFIGIAYLEFRRERKQYAIGIEILGLGVLLVTSFAQSLNGAQGLPYFVLLLVEALLILYWGTIQKRKIPFFSGIGAIAVGLLAQVIVLVSVYDINRWLVAFGVGLLIMGFAIYIERGREQLRARTREWSETLEKWE